MKNDFSKSPAVALLLWTTLTVGSYAQDPVADSLRMGFGDMAATKEKAEAGDTAAQVVLGNALSSHFRPAEALAWYRKAAGEGNVEAKFQLGRLLLFGAAGIPDDQRVQARPAEGIQWTFIAGTNFHPGACWNMYRAFNEGIGVRTNPVQAVAWLHLNEESQAAKIVARVELNQLALKLDTDTMAKGKQLAADFKAGKWQPPVARQIPEGDSHLKLNGISSGVGGPLAIINGKTLARGESAKLPSKTGTLALKVLEIGKDSVLVEIEGESEPRILRLR
jgi:TPR repeat protein